MTMGGSQGCRCELLDLGRYCGEVPGARLVSGCEHEHLDEEDLCARHADLAVRGDLWCNVCWRAGVRVRSVVLAKVLPSGEKRRVLEG